jgi:hypothetical protein
MAAPHVTGVAALLKAQDTSRDWKRIKNLILSGGNQSPALTQTISGRWLNAYGSMTCSDSPILTRLLPVANTTAGSIGTALDLAALNIDCARSAGDIKVSISPVEDPVTLKDDGRGADQAAGDGIYSAQWNPTRLGSYVLTFAGTEDTVGVQVLENYLFSRLDYNRRLITGTNLNLTDDSVAKVISPFPIPFGGGSFTDLYVGSNGTTSFTDPFAEFSNASMPLYWLPAVTLVAPFWDDLFPIPGTEQNVFWDVTGTAPNRELVVEWRDVRSFSCRSDPSATVTFQVVFSENSSDIVFNYTDVDFGGDCTWQDRGAAATIGIQVSPGKGTQWAYGETTNRSSLFDQSLADSTSILWQRESVSQEPKPVPTLTSLSPSSAVRGGPDFVLTLNGSGFVPTSRVHWGDMIAGQRSLVPRS